MRSFRWQWALSLVVTIVIVAIVYLQRGELLSALRIARRAHTGWLLAAFLAALAGYGCAALVYVIGLRALGLGGRRVGWVMPLTVVTTVLSSCGPAGLAASFGTLLRTCRQHGVPGAQVTVLATLHLLTYHVAEVLLVTYSLIYFLHHAGGADTREPAIIAAVVAVAVLGAAVFVLTRPESMLQRWATAAGTLAERLVRRPLPLARLHSLVSELIQARALLAAQPRAVAQMVFAQALALLAHSLALLLVVHALGEMITPWAASATFALVLIVSSFNVLPGGGGTIEVVLTFVLRQLGMGTHAVATAIVFRLIDFWLMVPLALLSFWWLSRTRADPAIVSLNIHDA